VSIDRPSTALSCQESIYDKAEYILTKTVDCTAFTRFKNGKYITYPNSDSGSFIAVALSMNTPLVPYVILKSDTYRQTEAQVIISNE